MNAINKEDVGKTYYFNQTVTIDNKPVTVIYCGILVGILPKYQFMDKFNSEYKRPTNYLFRVQNLYDQFITKTTELPEHIFNRLGEAIGYCKETPLFHYSVLLKQLGEYS